MDLCALAAANKTLKLTGQLLESTGSPTNKTGTETPASTRLALVIIISAGFYPVRKPPMIQAKKETVKRKVAFSILKYSIKRLLVISTQRFDTAFENGQCRLN
jgi:hypothetical protein